MRFCVSICGINPSTFLVVSVKIMVMKNTFILLVFHLLLISTPTKANIYWLYEFYNVSPNFNIFSLNDNEYQQCLKGKLSEKDYKKAVEYKTSITQAMEDAADQCVEKLLVSQLNTGLQQCLKNGLSDQSYNSLITKHFSKDPKKNDFKVFHKCLSELETKVVVASSERKNETNSCPEGYMLVNDTCQPDKSKKQERGGLNLEDPNLNSCLQKTFNQKSYGEIFVEGLRPPDNNEKKEIRRCLESVSEVTKGKKSKYDLNDPALNKCFKKMLGEKRYQEIIFSSSQNPNDQENKSITECQKDPDHWSAGSYSSGYNTPDFYYDIFDGNKMKDCISNSNPVFTHEITDFSEIQQLQRWGLTPQGYLKNHTYIFLKNKGHSGNKVIIDTPVPVYAPVDSYLILQTRYRLQGLKVVQWRLMFQVGCEIVYRFDHLDKPSDRILKHLGNIPFDEDQISAPNVAVKPPLKITAGEIIAHTKGTPQAGSWDFGVVDISIANELPKRLKKYENKPAGRQYKYAACPYDYYKKDIKKKYLKKMKGKKCNPKEIK